MTKKNIDITFAIVLVFLLAITTMLQAETPSDKKAESAFSEMKIYDADGRPWRIAKEDWDNARKLAADDPAWKSWLSEQQKSVDAWMAKFPHDRVEWIAGPGRFNSPKDSTPLIWTDKIPGEEIDHFYSATDPCTPITPILMGSWVNKFRGMHAKHIRLAGRLYRLTGDKRYAEWVAAQLQYYADNYEKWPLTTHVDPTYNAGDGTRLFYVALEQAMRTFCFIDANRLLGDYAAPETQKHWNENLYRPIATSLENHFFNKEISNICVWHLSAVAATGLMMGDERLWEKGLAGVRYQLSKGVTDDYIWYEQTFSYNNYTVAALQELFVAADLFGRGEELSREKNIAFNLMLSPMSLRLPDGYLPAIADAQRDSIPAPNRDLMMQLYRDLPTVFGLEEAAKEHNWDTLLDPPPAPPKNVSVLPEVKSRNFEATYLAQLKSGPWQVFFHYGQCTDKHAQNEILNYSACYNNIDITHNGGKWKYGTPVHSEYLLQAVSHNVPLINGQGQQKLPMRGTMTKFSTEPPVMRAVVEDYQPGVNVCRTLEIKNLDMVDTVKVNSQKTEPDIGLVLHLQGKTQLPPAFQSYSDDLFIKAHTPPFKFWKDIKRADYADRAELKVEYNGQLMKVVIETPGKFTLWYASTPDTPVPSQRESIYIETTGQQNRTFITTFTPDVQQTL